MGIAYLDLLVYPHVFVAGETGSGKSNVLKCLIHQALLKDYDVVLIDFKRGVSFSEFSEVVNICYEHQLAAEMLQELVKETERRLDLFREIKVDNLEAYNNVSGSYLRRTIVFIDELAELLNVREKTLRERLYGSLETLTRLSRAVGIHLIMGIQRPDSTIVNGQIKNNVSYRICGHFVDKEPSRIMLGNEMASNLDNIKGRVIVKGNEIQEVQCFYYCNQSAYRTHERKEEQLIEDSSLESNSEKVDIEKQSSSIDFDFDEL